MMPKNHRVSPKAKVNLREVTAETVRTIIDLEVTEEQRRFVAPNAVSIAQAYFEPNAWFRAICADDTPVGFVMLYDDPDKPEYFLWRFMIAAHYQGYGYGKKAIELLVEHLRNRPAARELLVSYVPEEGSPGPFYSKCGFVHTGRKHENEVEMRLLL